MKIKRLFTYMACLTIVAMVSSCSNEESVINNGQVTAFAGVMVSETPVTRVSFNAPNTPISTFLPATRTSINRTEIGGKGIFLWEPGDYIFVEDDNNELYKSQNKIIEKQPRSTFFVNGSYNGRTSYNVYYNGTNSGENPKLVVIPSEQIQIFFNNTSHFGESGDCGVAVAKKNNEAGKTGYKFDLTHKASYICFLPYIKEQAQRQTYKIQKIELSSNSNIAGTYNLSTTGISGEGSLNTITLRAGNDGLPLANQKVDAPNTDNSLYMIIPPGTHNIEITYTVFDNKTNQTLSYTKKYGIRTFEPNKIYELEVNLDKTAFDGEHNETERNGKISEANFAYNTHTYYMWDARENYWSGHEWDAKQPFQPTESEQGHDAYPQSKDADPNRWYNERVGTFEASTPLFQSLPNANEMAWYVMHGDAHWDNTTQWTAFGTSHTGGMWIKTLDVIAKEQGKTREELKNKNHENIDMRTIEEAYTFEQPQKGKPADNVIGNYFFLPALGFYENGELLHLEYGGNYWSSSSYSLTEKNAYLLYFTSNFIAVADETRKNGIPAYPFE